MKTRHSGEGRNLNFQFLKKWLKGWTPALVRLSLTMLSLSRSIAGVTLFLGSPAQARPPEIGPVPSLKFHPPKPTRVTLSNGIVVYILEDHELPLFHLSLRFKVSPADIAESKRGTLSLMGSVWRSGGTMRRKPEDLNDVLETNAISIETSVGEEMASAGVSCLTDDQSTALALFKEVLFEPAFQSDQVKLAKDKILEGLRRKNDDPWNIGRRAFRDALYGKTHLYSWNPTPESVGRMTRADLVALHQKILAPNQAIISVAGNFETQALLAQLENLFGSWKGKARVVPEFDYSLKQPSTATVTFVDKDLTQSLIYTGGLGISRHNPDVFALSVTNSILGEGGPSRLFAQVRSRLGLAYVVASFYTEPKGPGLIGAACQTKAATTGQALEAVRKELSKLGSEPVKTEELRDAKDSILNAFVFRFKSRNQIVGQAADLEFYGYEADYLEKYPSRIEGITRERVNEIGKKYYAPDKFKVLIVGSRPSLETFLQSVPGFLEIPLREIE